MSRVVEMIKRGEMGGGIAYLLHDDFNDTVAAGSVNGTLATPKGGARTVTDTNSKFSVGSGLLSLATGQAINDKIVYPAQDRAVGKCLFFRITVGSTGNFQMGYTGAGNDYIQFRGTGNIGLVANSATIFDVSAFSNTTYIVAAIQRATGFLWFIRGGVFTTWTLIYPTITGAASGTSPFLASAVTTSVLTVDFIRIPQSAIRIIPVASDGFGTSETLGNTRGGGSAESGGAGLPYTKVGTWASNGTVAACSALAGGIGAALVDVGTANVILEAVATRAAGNMGFYLRYTDANNNIKATYDGTNWTIVETVSGTPNTILAPTAATYGATKRTVISLNATKVRLYYGDALVGSEATTAIAAGTKMGLYTDDTGATFDNFVVWAKGSGGEYEGLFNRYANP